MCSGAEPAVAAEAGAKGAADVVGSSLMPAAVAETPAALASQGLVQTGVGAWSAAEPFAAGAASGVSGSSILNSAKTIATIASPITSLVQAAGGVESAKRAGSSITNATQTPIVTPPVTMPTFGNADTLNSMRANIQEQLVRRGRAATILTSETGGGSKLGN